MQARTGCGGSALLVAGTLIVQLLCNSASAQVPPSTGTNQSCPDAFADIYFMPDADKYPQGLPAGTKEVLPKQHLHLPRALLQVNIRRGEDAITPSRLCDRSAFAALDVLYGSTPDLAKRLGIKYPTDTPSPLADQILIFGRSTPIASVDDTADREGTARRGYWVFDNKRSAGAAIYFFCVPPLPGPPNIREPCYVTADMQHMGYLSGNFGFFAQPFVNSTFYTTELKARPFLRLVTPEVLDNYFAFQRSLSQAVIVDDTVNPPK